MSEMTSDAVTTSWGQVDTPYGRFRDAKLWPGGGRAWDWNETGTHHSPGVHPDDLADLFDQGVEIVVIGIGRESRLGVTDEVLRAAEVAGISLEMMETTEAVRRYNELIAAEKQIGALIHSTC